MSTYGGLSLTRLGFSLSLGCKEVDFVLENARFIHLREISRSLKSSCELLLSLCPLFHSFCDIFIPHFWFTHKYHHPTINSFKVTHFSFYYPTGSP